MASFFQRALDKITPWRRSGEVQRDQEVQERRRRREEEQPQVRQNAPQSQRNAPQVQQQNNKTIGGQDFTFGTLKVNNQVTPPKSEFDPSEPPKPKQSFFNKVRDQFDANTEADQYRRMRGNAEKGETKEIKLTNPGNIVSKTPIVGFAAKGANTLANQAREVVETGRGAAASATNNQEALRSSLERQDKLRKNYQTNKGGLFNVGTLTNEEEARSGDIGTGIKKIAAPTAVSMLDVFTLGKGNLIDDAIRQSGLIPGIRSQASNIGKAVLGNYGSGDIGARSEGATNEEAIKSGLINSILGIAPDIGLPAIARSFSNRVLPKFRRGQVPAGDLAQELDDAAISASAEAAIQASQPRPISVRQNIPVDEAVQEAIPVNVRNTTPQGPMIREVAGDAINPVRVPTPNEALEAAVSRDFQNQPFPRPDERIEGVTPRQGEQPYSIDPEVATSTETKLIQDYADMLKQMGEGNGVDILPDGRRVSNNVRFGDTGGKRMTKADWYEEAERQLRAGKADSSIQKAFNDASDPEVQSLLARGEQPSPEPGRPIEVKQVDSIPVQDRTDVPVIPEKPGTVRATRVADQTKAETQAVASSPVVARPDATPIETTPPTRTDMATPTAKEVPTALPANDLDFLKSINDVTQSNIRQAREALKNRRKVVKAQKGAKNANMEGLRQRIYDEGGSVTDADKAVAAAMRGKEDGIQYKGTGIGEDAEKRLSKMIDDDPDLKGLNYSKENIQRAFRNLYRTGEEGYPDHLIKSDLKQIGRWLNRKVPSMGDAFEEASKDLVDLDQASRKVQIAAMPRVVQASADVGGIGRQAMPLGLSNPKQFKDAIKESFKGMFNQKYYDDAIKKIEQDKNFYFINDEMKVALPGVVKDNKAVEQFAASGLAEKLPVIGPVVKASQRQYDLLLTKLRYDVAAKKMEKDGGMAAIIKAADESGDPKVFKQAYGDAINLLSGKSDIGNLIKNNPGAMNSLFFSAPNLASKINRLNPAYYAKLWKANPSAAKTAIMGNAVHLGTVGSVLLAANQAGLVEDGKIKVGNTRYDVTGGLATLINAGAKMYKAATSEGDSGPFSKTATDELLQFMRNQANPALGWAFALGDTTKKEGGNFFTDREDKFGNDYNMLTDTAKSFTIPFSVQQLYEDLTKGLTTPEQAAANLLAGVFGVGVNTYETGAGKKEQEATEASSSTGRLSAYIPEGEDATKDKVIKGALDRAYYEGDWGAYADGMSNERKRVQDDPNSTKKQIDEATLDHKRSVFYNTNEGITPDLVDSYDSIGVEDWRKMGIPPGDDKHDPEMYNPELYQQLWDIDKAMSAKGLGFAKDKSKGKYYQKDSKGGGSGRSKLGAPNFGTLDKTTNAPKVKEYATMEQANGSIPYIRKTRPNIVYKIGTGR